MKTIITAIYILVACSACMKLEIKPGSVVSDTIDAGKDAYHTIKRSRNGEEERIYSHTIHLNSDKSNALNIATCKDEVTEIINASSLTVSKIISESSEIIEKDSVALVICSLTALVRPN